MDTTENTDFVCVLAGYRNLMTKMMNANLNLMSRMGNWLDFPDYDDGELLEISSLLAKSYQYNYDEQSKAKFVEFMNIRKVLIYTVLSLSSLKFYYVHFIDQKFNYPYRNSPTFPMPVQSVTVWSGPDVLLLPESSEMLSIMVPSTQWTKSKLFKLVISNL